MGDLCVVGERESGEENMGHRRGWRWESQDSPGADNHHDYGMDDTVMRWDGGSPCHVGCSLIWGLGGWRLTFSLVVDSSVD